MSSDLSEGNSLKKLDNVLKPKPNGDTNDENNNLDNADFITWIDNNYTFPTFLTRNYESIIFGLLALFSFGFSLLIDPIFPTLFWQLLFIDLFISMVFSFPQLRNKSIKINESLPKLINFNITNYFSKISVLYRISRLLLYYLVTLFLSRGIRDLDLLVLGVAVLLLIFSYAILSVYYEMNPANKLIDWFSRRNSIIKMLIVIVSIGIIGVMARLYHVYSIGTWDEGWFADIAMRMAYNDNWLLPLYYSDSINSLKLFDKPPFIFWLGALAIKVFGNISLAAKWPMGVLSGLMGIFGFLLYHHQKRQFYHDTIPRIDSKSTLDSLNTEKTEEEEKTSDGFSIGIIFGLLMSLSWFVTFYGRTSYLDPAIVALTALTAVFAVKAIDHWFYGNTKKAYFYIMLTGLINAIDLLSKAWQGLIVGPPIALYFFIRFFQHFVPKYNIKKFWKLLRPKLTSITKDFETEIGAILGAILALIIFSSLRGEAGIKLNFDLLILSSSIDLWGVIVAIILFFVINSFLQIIFRQTSISEPAVDEKDGKPAEESDGYAYLYPTESQKNIFRLSKQVLYILLGLGLGIIGAYLANIGFDLIYSRFLEPLSSIVLRLLGSDTSVGSIDWGTGGLPEDFRITIGILATGLFSLISATFISLIGIWLVGIFILGCIQLIKELFDRNKKNRNLDSNLFYSNFDASWAKGIIIDFSLLIPLIPLAVAIGFWGLFLFFFGEFFNRDWFLITIYGIIILFISFLVSLFLLKVIRNAYKYQLSNLSGYSDVEDYYLNRWTLRYEKFLLFTLVLLIFIIISFTPFIWWVQEVDGSLEELGYVIRQAGECFPKPGDPIDLPKCPPESDLTYTWIFFTFYTDWRYNFATNYDLVSSISGVYEPITVICVPFFIAGIYLLHKRREYATLGLYLSWLLLVIFIFVPAKFQLNYYYLAVFFPYLGISAYGIFFSLQKIKSSIHLKDMYERTVLLGPLFILLIVSQIGPYLFNLNVLLSNYGTLRNFIATLILIIGLFLVLALFLVRSIPGMFAAMFLTFWMHDYLWENGWGQFDEMYLFITLILIGIPLYLLRDRIPLKSLFFLGLIVSTGALGSAWWIDWKSGNGEDGYESMANFILDHGGGQDNKSYWMYGEAGSRHSVRYYLNGSDPINIRQGVHLPFQRNDSTIVEDYIIENPTVNFFIVLSRSVWDNVVAQAEYTEAYKWLSDHFVDVGPLINKADWHHIRLFVNPDVLTFAEKEELNLNDFDLNPDSYITDLSNFTTEDTSYSNLTEREFISILSDSQLSDTASTNNWKGSGDENDPYIIENYNITVNNSFTPAIRLQAITKHVEINNNVLSNLNSGDPGIRIFNAPNVSISNNIVNNGIDIYNSKNVRILNNYINGNGLSNQYGISIKENSDVLIQKNYINGLNDGINLETQSSANITNNVISNMAINAIRASFANRISVDLNVLVNNTNGILVTKSPLIIKNNIIRDTLDTGIQLYSETDFLVDNNTIQNSLVNGISIDIRFDYESNNNFTISNNIISYNKFDGIIIKNSTDFKIINNSINHNGMNGIWILKSHFSIIEKNLFFENGRSGIKFLRSTGNSIMNNSLSRNFDGIAFEECFFIQCFENRSKIIENHIRNNNNHGIYTRDVQGLDFTRNIFYNNLDFGVYLLNSYYNNIYQNSFINNSNQAYSDVNLNNFTFLNKGNYWSDYYGKDENSDGIGDQTYQISGSKILFDIAPVFNLILEDVNPDEWHFITIPSSTNPESPAIDGFVFILAILGIMFVIFLRKRRKKFSKNF
ncbi:MAG: right-handed parallel beta-helix repeat-containing protein [Candidatus Hodarchaeales archaeon]|jgi:parallel beta-helix repeat protein